MNRGFAKSILYYIIGLGLAGLSYFTLGHEYAHGPSAYHLVILATFFGGFLWFVAAAIRYLTGHRTKTMKGVIWTNFVMSFGFIVFMAYILRDETGAGRSEDIGEERIVIETSGDTTIIYHGGSPVYMKVKDSVLLDFIDSAKVNWDKVER